MVKWVQRTVLLQSCCDSMLRKSLNQFKITISQYQCYSISIFFFCHCSPCILQENNGYSLIYLKGSLIEKTESIWVIWTQLQLGDYNSRKSDLLFKWVHMVLHALPVPVWVFSGYSGFLPQLKHACLINWLFWVTLRMQVWMAVFPSVSVALQTGDLSSVYPISHPLSSWACSNPSSQMSG